MPYVSTVVTVTTTATRLCDGRPRRASVLVDPPASGTVFLGGPDVTATGATKGRALSAGDDPFLVTQAFKDDDSPGEPLYAITASGSLDVPVLEIRL